MRGDIELLERLWKCLDSVERLDGLCDLLVKLHHQSKISTLEYYHLKDLLKNHRRSQGYGVLYYWWPQGYKKPRLDFIQELINQKYKEMGKHHWKVVGGQLLRVVIGGDTPAYGIPPFLWETDPKTGRIKHWLTLKNYLQWLELMK